MEGAEARAWMEQEERRINEFLQQQQSQPTRPMAAMFAAGPGAASGARPDAGAVSRILLALRERKERTVKIRGKISFLAGVLIALGAGWVGFPYAIYKSRPQPVDFSHKVHADKAGAKCEDCHAFREDGTFAGMPTLDKCAGCHAARHGHHRGGKELHRSIRDAAARAAVGGLRAPAGERLLFPHHARQAGPGSKCEQCHGDEGASDHAAALPAGPHQRLFARHLQVAARPATA